MDMNRQLLSAVIGNGGSLAPAVDMLGGSGAENIRQAVTLAGIVMPASWTTANLTFDGSHDNITFNPVYDENGSELVIVAAAARFIVVTPRLLIAPHFLKVRSGTNGTPVSQGAERTIGLIVRPVL